MLFHLHKHKVRMGWGIERIRLLCILVALSVTTYNTHFASVRMFVCVSVCVCLCGMFKGESARCAKNMKPIP